MKDNSTFIAIVLDRSGSMSDVRDATIEGFNKFLDDQQKLPGEALLTLAQFDDQYEIVHDAKPVKEVPKLTVETFVPRGWTALFDAIGRTIDAVGARLSCMPDGDRPAKVVVAIITDGHENRSTEYTGKRIAEMIKLQSDKYSWEFVFLGANQDSFATAGDLGVTKGNIMNYAANTKGAHLAFSSLSAGTSDYRKHGVRGRYFNTKP